MLYPTRNIKVAVEEFAPTLAQHLEDHPSQIDLYLHTPEGKAAAAKRDEVEGEVPNTLASIAEGMFDDIKQPKESAKDIANSFTDYFSKACGVGTEAFHTDCPPVPELIQVVIPKDTAELTVQAANMAREENVSRSDAADVGEVMDDSHRDIETLKKLQKIGTESLKTGGLSFDNAAALNATVNRISTKYGIKAKKVGLEDFFYEDTQIVATENLVTKTVDVLTALVKTVGKAAGELTDILTQSIKRMIIRGGVIVKKADAEIDRLNKLPSNFKGADVNCTGMLNKLRINGQLDAAECAALATKEMDVAKIASSWQGIWAKRKDGVIYRTDLQEQSTDFLESLTTSASKGALKAMPSGIGNAAPIKVLGMPGDVYIVLAKGDNAIVKTGWTDGNQPDTNETLPALQQTVALEYAKAARALGDVLQRELGSLVKTSDTVHAAAIELSNEEVSDDSNPTRVKQAKENVKAAYACQNALLRSVWNTAEGLLAYVSGSMFDGRDDSNHANVDEPEYGY